MNDTFSNLLKFWNLKNMFFSGSETYFMINCFTIFDMFFKHF